MTNSLFDSLIYLSIYLFVFHLELFVYILITTWPYQRLLIAWQRLKAESPLSLVVVI